MGSSSSGGNPMYLSQGAKPIPGLPIAGQGAPNDNPRTFGQFQEFLPTIQAPGGTAGGYTIPSDAESRAAPNATGLKSEMFQFRSPFSGAGPATVSNSGANTGGTSGSGGNGTTTTGGTASPSDIDSLRQQLAALQAKVGSGTSNMIWQPGMRGSGSVTDGWQPSEMGMWVPGATS